MRDYTILKLLYPGVIRIEKEVWVKFQVNNENFAFKVNDFKKGLVVFDQDNEIIFNESYSLKKEIKEIKSKNVGIHPTGENGELGFYNITETDTNVGRCFYDQSYTELLLLIRTPEKKVDIELICYYLNHLFIKYSTSFFKSTIQIPKQSYWEESIKVYQSSFQTGSSFEELIKTGLDHNLNFKLSTIYIRTSKHGILPQKKSDVFPVKQLREIPEEFIDVFELYSSGLMQMNYYNNFKLALLESFVAVEILVVRITDQQKKKRGISNTKLKEYKKEINISYRTDVELKLFFDFNENEKLLLGKISRARSIRNKIMHANHQIDEEEIREIIQNINEFIFMLINKSES